MPAIKKAKKTEPVAGLVLAAGASTRMGTPKQLLQAGHALLIERVLSQALESDLDRVILVLGYMAEEIRERIRFRKEPSRLEIVENSGYTQGISSSILSGLSRVEKDYNHVLILLGDMPHITSGVVNRLLAGYLASGLALGALKVEGRRSHPVVIGWPFFPALHQLTGDRGARDLFLRYSDQVCLVEPGEEYKDSDIDTYEEYLEFKKTLE